MFRFQKAHAIVDAAQPYDPYAFGLFMLFRREAYLQELEGFQTRHVSTGRRFPL